jgi:nucleotide-binding universal stress UspA family protein
MSAPPRKILIGYDGSDCSRRALELAASVARDGNGVTLATVAPVLFGQPDPAFADEQRRTLEEGKELLAAQGVHAETVGPLEDDAARGLVRTAEKIGADLIVVGTHGHGTLARLALGSVAGGVVERAGCSVLVVR